MDQVQFSVLLCRCCQYSFLGWHISRRRLDQAVAANAAFHSARAAARKVSKVFWGNQVRLQIERVVETVGGNEALSLAL